MIITRRDAGLSIVVAALSSSTRTIAPFEAREVLGVAGQGQSNMTGDLPFGQRHRIPDMYDRAQDGPPALSIAGPGVFTIAHGRVAPLRWRNRIDGAQSYGEETAETSMFGFAAQLRRHCPERDVFVSVTGAQGASPLSVLRRPTRAEIRIGRMIAADREIAIPADSLERAWLAGLPMRELWRSTAPAATPWYRDARTQAIAAHHFRRHQQNYRVAFMPMQHGETLPRTPYTRELLSFYDEKQACWREITGQTTEAALIQEIASYAPFHEIIGEGGFDHWKETGYSPAAAPGGPASRYAAEKDRSNLMFERNVEQVGAVGAGGRRIYVSHAKYPLTSLIHHDQYGQRWAGEMMGLRACEIEGFVAGTPLSSPSARAGDEITLLRFDQPITLQKYRGYQEKAGHPFGLSARSIDGNWLTLEESAVRISDDQRTLAILHPGSKVAQVEYVSHSRSGAICSLSKAALIGRDRGNLPFVANRYCCPFQVKIA